MEVLELEVYAERYGWAVPTPGPSTCSKQPQLVDRRIGVIDRRRVMLTTRSTCMEKFSTSRVWDEVAGE